MQSEQLEYLSNCIRYGHVYIKDVETLRCALIGVSSLPDGGSGMHELFWSMLSAYRYYTEELKLKLPEDDFYLKTNMEMISEKMNERLNNPKDLTSKEIRMLRKYMGHLLLLRTSQMQYKKIILRTKSILYFNSKQNLKIKK